MAVVKFWGYFSCNSPQLKLILNLGGQLANAKYVV